MNPDLARKIIAHAGDVVNQHHLDHQQKRTAYYVGRGSPYGNPYKIEGKITREESVRLYTAMVARMEPVVRIMWLTPIAKKLREGIRLRCFCAPALCHAMVLAMWVRMHPEFASFWTPDAQTRTA